MHTYIEKFSSSGNFTLYGWRYYFNTSISTSPVRNVKTLVIYPPNTPYAILKGYYDNTGNYIQSHEKEDYEYILN